MPNANNLFNRPSFVFKLAFNTQGPVLNFMITINQFSSKLQLAPFQRLYADVWSLRPCRQRLVVVVAQGQRSERESVLRVAANVLVHCSAGTSISCLLNRDKKKQTNNNIINIIAQDQRSIWWIQSSQHLSLEQSTVEDKSNVLKRSTDGGSFQNDACVASTREDASSCTRTHAPTLPHGYYLLLALQPAILRVKATGQNPATLLVYVPAVDL